MAIIKKQENPHIEWAKQLLKRVIKGQWDDAVEGPATWLTATLTNHNVSNYYIWRVEKEKTLERQSIRQHTGYYEINTPDGRHVIPLRQFCEFVPLKTGQNEAFFYHFTEPLGYKPLAEGTGMAPVSTISHTRIDATSRGKQEVIPFHMLEDRDVNPTDFVIQTNNSFVVQTIDDENKAIIDKILGTVLYPQETLTFKELRPLTLDRVKKGIEELIMKGYNPRDFILITPSSGQSKLFRDIKDKYIGTGIGANWHNLITNILGVNAVRNKDVRDIPCVIIEPKPETYWQRFFRVLLFRKPPTHKVETHCNLAILMVNKHTMGLVTGDALTMEAQRRAETQNIHINGTHRIGTTILEANSFITMFYKDEESW